MKKVLAMVLAVMMLVSVLCVSVSADAVENAPAFVVDSASALAGQTVSVAVRTQNNPGIVGLRVAVGYDPAVLTPTAMVEQDFAGATFGPLTANPLSIMWVDAIHPDVTEDGVVALLTFRVAEDAPVGSTPLTLSLVDEEDIFNAAMDVVAFDTVDGSISVVSYTPGDVDNDGKVNVRDLGRLQQYLNGWEVAITLAAADVTGDDKVNVRDLGILQQHLNGWDVELKPGGSSLGGGSQPEEPVDPPVDPDVPVDPPIDPDVPVEPAGSATIDFTAPNRVSQDANQQVWQENGITVTNNKAGSGTDVGDYGGNGYAARFYKNSELIITYPGMTQIVFHCDNYQNNDYAGALVAAIVTGTAVQNGTDVTVTLDAAVDTYTIPDLSGGQVRMVGITINPSEGGDNGGGESVDPPVDPDPDVPEEPDDSVEAILEAAFALQPGEVLPYEVTLSGKVLDVETPYDANYSNITVNITVEGKTIKCYRLKGDGVDQIKEGDTITVTGTIKNYNGTVEFDTGCQMTERVAGSSTNLTLSVVDTPKVGVAYKFGMVQENLSTAAVYYLKGGMASTYYLATSSSASAAIDVYLEATNGGYYLYTNYSGSKQYINMVQSGTHVNGVYEAAASTVYTFDTELQTLVATFDGEKYVFGTPQLKNDAPSTYTTVGGYRADDTFYCQLYA